MPNLNEYIPDHLREFPEITAIMDAIQPELDAIWERLEQVWGDQYTQTMSEAVYKRWRRALKIPFPSDAAWEAETDPDVKEAGLRERAEFVRQLAMQTGPVTVAGLQEMAKLGFKIATGLPAAAGSAFGPRDWKDPRWAVLIYDFINLDEHGALVQARVWPRAVLSWLRRALPANRKLEHYKYIYQYNPERGVYELVDTVECEEVLL